MPRRMAHAPAIENWRKNGGSLTPQNHIGQINEFSACASIAVPVRRVAGFISNAGRTTGPSQQSSARALASQHVRAQRCRLERRMLSVFGGLLDREMIRAGREDGALEEAQHAPAT